MDKWLRLSVSINSPNGPRYRYYYGPSCYIPQVIKRIFEEELECLIDIRFNNTPIEIRINV